MVLPPCPREVGVRGLGRGGGVADSNPIGPRIGSLFSGYGGLDLAVQSVLGGEVAWHVEFDKSPAKVLSHHWPQVPNLGDVTTINWDEVPRVDVLTGGYPCQPFSHAGKRKGTKDERHLWPYVCDAIRALGPSLVVLENVRGHLTLGFDTVLADLADMGWSAEWGVVRASDAGACHQRARLFIVAYPERERHHGGRGPGTAAEPRRGRLHAQGLADDAADADGSPGESGVSGVGVPNLEGCGESAADAVGGGRGRRSRDPQRRPQQRVAAAGVGEDIPADADAPGPQGGESEEGHPLPAWGDYEPAIRRWEHIIGRPAPAPTEPGRTGKPRLSPVFVEWMMGLDAGHVTDPQIGLSRNEQLKILGNGVVPAQAALALSLLLPRIGETQ